MILQTIARAARHSRPFIRSTRCCCSTYYDSQSGLHVPVHKEEEITLFLNQLDFIPRQLYKDDESLDMRDKVVELQRAGVHGLFSPKAQFPRDDRNLQTLVHIAPLAFTLFAFSEPEELSPNISPIVKYREQMEDNLGQILKKHATLGIKTTIALGENCYDGEAATVASRIATVIDSSPGAENYLWLNCSYTENPNIDSIMRLCEELLYLDVPGSTVKFRMIVNFLNEDFVNDIMMLGVNKFVIEAEEQIALVQKISKEQGKHLLSGPP
jgi:hypothetical protein